MKIARNTALATILVASCSLAFAGTASASPKHRSHGSVSYSHAPHHGGSQRLVSDGPGTGFGFHRLPAPYRVAGAIERDRQRAAVKSAVLDDAVESQPYGFGFYGDSVYGAGSRAAYGVYNGADGYGSPYFAGFYGPGDGADLGPLGHAYAN